MGLETVQMLINAMYGQLIRPKQIELLHKAINEEDGRLKLIGIMNKAYISQNQNGLHDLLYASTAGRPHYVLDAATAKTTETAIVLCSGRRSAFSGTSRFGPKDDTVRAVNRYY